MSTLYFPIIFFLLYICFLFIKINAKRKKKKKISGKSVTQGITSINLWARFKVMERKTGISHFVLELLNQD